MTEDLVIDDLVPLMGPGDPLQMHGVLNGRQPNGATFSRTR